LIFKSFNILFGSVEGIVGERQVKILEDGLALGSSNMIVESDREFARELLGVSIPSHHRQSVTIVTIELIVAMELTLDLKTTLVVDLSGVEFVVSDGITVAVNTVVEESGIEARATIIESDKEGRILILFVDKALGTFEPVDVFCLSASISIGETEVLLNAVPNDLDASGGSRRGYGSGVGGFFFIFTASNHQAASNEGNAHEFENVFHCV
jgi:hypothetical protein